MDKFQTALIYITKNVYEPNKLAVTLVQEKPKNAKYGAGIFKIDSKLCDSKLRIQLL